MNNQLKPFKYFILAARADSNLTDQHSEYKKLIQGFYKIVSQTTYTDPAVKKYLNDRGYNADEKDLKKIASLHYSTKWFWRFDDEDY